MWQWITGAEEQPEGAAPPPQQPPPQPQPPPSADMSQRNSVRKSLISWKARKSTQGIITTDVAGQSNTNNKSMDMQQTVFLVVSLMVAGLGWLLAVVGLATDHWTFEGVKIVINNATVEVETAVDLFLFPDKDPMLGYIKMGVAGMIILGIVLASTGILLIGVDLMMLLKDNPKKCLPICGGVTFVIGGFFTLLGPISYFLFITIILNPNEIFFWSFDVTIAGGVLLILDGMFVSVGTCILKKKH